MGILYRFRYIAAQAMEENTDDDNPNPPKKRKLEPESLGFYCRACGINLRDWRQWEDHKKGKKHKSMCRAQGLPKYADTVEPAKPYVGKK